MFLIRALWIRPLWGGGQSRSRRRDRTFRLAYTGRRLELFGLGGEAQIDRVETHHRLDGYERCGVSADPGFEMTEARDRIDSAEVELHEP